MTASVVKEPFNHPDWIFETKQDGFRAIALIDSTGKARLWSRNRLPLEQKFPIILNAVRELNLRSTILDGEVLALDDEGVPRFQLLQKWQKRSTAPIVYVLFDLLWDNGRDLTGKKIVQRRERLQEIVTPVAGIQVGSYVENRGIDLYRLAKGRKHFSALLLGAYRNGNLHYFGHSGSGFSENALKETVDRLKPLFTTKCPFDHRLRLRRTLTNQI